MDGRGRHFTFTTIIEEVSLRDPPIIVHEGFVGSYYGPNILPEFLIIDNNHKVLALTP